MSTSQPLGIVKNSQQLARIVALATQTDQSRQLSSEVVIKGSFLCFTFLAQLLQSSTICFIWAVIPGHHTEDIVHHRHLSAPWWPSWILLRVSRLIAGGTTIRLLNRRNCSQMVSEPRTFQNGFRGLSIEFLSGHLALQYSITFEHISSSC